MQYKTKQKLLIFSVALSTLFSPAVKADIRTNISHAVDAVSAGAASLLIGGAAYYFSQEADYNLSQYKGSRKLEQQARFKESPARKAATRQYAFNAATAATLSALGAYCACKFAQQSFKSASHSPTTTALTGLAAFGAYKLGQLYASRKQHRQPEYI